MKKQNGLYTGTDEFEQVEIYLSKMDHPMLDCALYLRKLILSCSEDIGQGIYWNVPTFYYTKAMLPFEPKEYKRYIVGFNFFKQDSIRLIFLTGAHLPDPSKLLEGSYSDGRRLITFTGIDDVKNKEKALKQLVKSWLENIQ